MRLSESAVRMLLAASQEVVSLESGGPALLQRSLASGERVADWADKLADPDCHKDPYEVSPTARALTGIGAGARMISCSEQTSGGVYDGTP